MTCREAVLGAVDETFTDVNGVKYKIIKPSKPGDVIYDASHDNPTVFQKFKTGKLALPHAGLISMAD